MRFIDPHIHMTARTTDDYERMAAAGIVAVIEPAFWLGQPRTSVGTFVDYLSTIVGWERFRAAQFGIRHYCAIGLNAKEANNIGKRPKRAFPRSFGTTVSVARDSGKKKAPFSVGILACIVSRHFRRTPGRRRGRALT